MSNTDESGYFLDGLGSVPELYKGDTVLVNTDGGVKGLPSEVLGEVLSNTSLFETYNRLQVEQSNVEYLYTSRKIKKYLIGDTSPELFTEIDGGELTIIYGEVIFVNDEPDFEQETDKTGEALYWSADPKTAVQFREFPWKTDKDKKIFIGYEKTDYPVKVYKYLEYTLRKFHIEILDGKATITDIYSGIESNTYGNIIKDNEKFEFKMSNDNNSCGIQVYKNADGTLKGELIGSWDGLNDIDPDKRLTKDNAKEFLYNSQDYNTHLKVLSVDTSDKIGWYLMKDTSHHVYSISKDDYITMNLAEVKTLGGVDQTEHARNIFGKLLYWTEDMSSGGGVDDSGIPVKNGIHVYMTTEPNSYPVNIYQYNIKELSKLQYSQLPDGSFGIKQIFNDLFGNYGSIYKDSSNLNLVYYDASSGRTKNLSINKDGGSLEGKWLITPPDSDTPIDLSVNELPIMNTGLNAPFLSYDTSGAKWSEGYPLDLELPASSSSYTIDMISGVQNYICKKRSGSVNIILSNLDSVKARTTKTIKIVVPQLTSTLTITWDSNIVSTSEEDKQPSSTGYTEFTLTYHSSLDTYTKPVFLSKTVYTP